MELRGARVFLREDRPVADSAPCGPGSAAVVTRPSPQRDGPGGNEDGALALSLTRGRAVLAVADGVGGGPGGAEAAGAALVTLATTVIAGAERNDGLRIAILDGIEQAQRAVRALGGGPATTLAVVGIDGDRMRPFHVGDSEILLVGQRGKIKHRTLAHTPTAYAVESGYLEEREAMLHDERHLVTNALGLPEFRIEIGPRLRVAPRDTLLLSTDGLTDNLTLEEIADRIRTGPLDERASGLGESARRRMARAGDGRIGKPDDVTIVLWRRDRDRPGGAA
jgi:serine/threonine protein phosphatase PrpC